MSDPKLAIHADDPNAANDLSGAVSNDEETRLDAPLPPSAHGPNTADDEGRVPEDAEPGEGPL